MAFTIRGLPPALAQVPDDRLGWLRWRDAMLAFREVVHRQCADPEQRAIFTRLAADDPAFFCAVFGVILEPRARVDFRVTDDGELEPVHIKAGWYPWIPYPFQIGILRFIEAMMARDMDPLGRGDGVIEKSRDMGATWLMALYAGHQWLFADNFTAGFISHKEALVDSRNQKAIFYRIEAIIGLNRKVPSRVHMPDTPYHGCPLRLPDFLFPAGFEPKEHDMKLALIHPTKNNAIYGEATTSKSGIGDRLAFLGIDEGGKIENLLEIWDGMGATTDHRLVLSSADRRFGDGFYTLAQQGRGAVRNPDAYGPALMTLHWDLHPMRDDAWYERERARYAHDPSAFSREYEIDYYAGFGDWVYPQAKTIVPMSAPYDPAGGAVTVSLDPAVRDPTAVGFFQRDPGNDRYNLFEALTIITPSADYLAPILLGFPPGHPERDQYHEMQIHEVMNLTWELRNTGVDVAYVGDTYGDNAGGGNHESYYMALARRVDELCDQYPDLPKRRITVMTKYDQQSRSHIKRREMTAKLIPRLVVNDTPRCRYVLEAIQNYAYKPQDEHRASAKEPQEPIHNWASHPATMCEYFAIYEYLREALSGPRQKPFVPSKAVRKPGNPFVRPHRASWPGQYAGRNA